MKVKLWPGIFLMAVFAFAACSRTSPYLPIDQIPASNNEELQLNQAFDYVYLAAFDAANSMTNWTPEKTNKDTGLIRVRNTQFKKLDDADLRVVNVRIRRDGPNLTSVFLDPDSRRVIGADVVFAAVRKKLGVPPPA